jgi:hypothetical protein
MGEKYEPVYETRQALSNSANYFTITVSYSPGNRFWRKGRNHQIVRVVDNMRGQGDLAPPQPMPLTFHTITLDFLLAGLFKFMVKLFHLYALAILIDFIYEQSISGTSQHDVHRIFFLPSSHTLG